MGKEKYEDSLVEYIKKNLKKGYTKESLKWALVNQGHSRREVEKALELVDEKLANEAPILETKPEIKVEIIPKVKPEDLEAAKDKRPFWKKILGL